MRAEYSHRERRLHCSAVGYEVILCNPSMSESYSSVNRRPMDVEDYFDIVRRHKAWILGPTFAALVVSTVVTCIWPDTYVSTGDHSRGTASGSGKLRAVEYQQPDVAARQLDVSDDFEPREYDQHLQSV